MVFGPKFSMRIPRDPSNNDWPEIWKSAYHILEERIVPTQFKAWIQPLQLLGTVSEDSKTILQLSVANEFSAQWLKDKYQKPLEDAFQQVIGTPCEVTFVIERRSQEQTGSPSESETVLKTRDLRTEITPSERDFQPLTVSASEMPGPKKVHRPVDPRFIFDSFVVGASNQFAHASAYAVAERPGQQYNPLFLYGPPGLGKTHLLHAIGNQILSNNPHMRVGYLSAENFVNELIEALQQHRMPQFRATYRNSYDMLLIDDIQFIAGKKQTEEEFFHTFNTLYGAKRQIVLTSDRPPKEIDKLEERIRTRFEWGLVADIQPPEIETRIAILKVKAERDDIYLPDEVATFLAGQFKSNVRELEGTLIRLQAQASLTGAEISLEMAKQETKQIQDELSESVTPESIQQVVSDHFNIKISDLLSSTRTKAFSLPRQISMYLVRKYTELGWKQIGEFFEKDHTTVMHAYEKIEQGLDKDEEIKRLVEAIQNKL